MAVPPPPKKKLGGVTSWKSIYLGGGGVFNFGVEGGDKKINCQ